jgi:hypothetical protein
VSDNGEGVDRVSAGSSGNSKNDSKPESTRQHLQGMFIARQEPGATGERWNVFSQDQIHALQERGHDTTSQMYGWTGRRKQEVELAQRVYDLRRPGPVFTKNS